MAGACESCSCRVYAPRYGHQPWAASRQRKGGLAAKAGGNTGQRDTGRSPGAKRKKERSIAGPRFASNG
jgi:hypothetical protein